MTLIGVLTAIASLLVFGIANAMPASNGLSTLVTVASNPTTSDNSVSETTEGTILPSTSLLDEAIVGETRYEVGEAGSVVIGYDGTTLTLVLADANVPWTAFSEHTSGTEIEVEFTGDRLIKFKAELEDGGIRIVVEEQALDFTTDSTLATSDNSTDSTISTPTTIDDDDMDADNEMDDDDEIDDDLDDESDHDEDDSTKGSSHDDDDDDDDGDDDHDEDHGDDD